jgi:hypothetical protein
MNGGKCMLGALDVLDPGVIVNDLDGLLSRQ